MKKLILLISILVGFNLTSQASSFKLDARAIESKFTAAQELNISTVDMSSLTQNTAVKGDVSRVTAGVLGIFCGNFGIHRFYMGHTNAGIVYLVVGIVTGTSVSSIAGVIDGVIYLLATDDEFNAKYAHNENIIQWIAN